MENKSQKQMRNQVKEKTINFSYKNRFVVNKLYK